jgi:predicted DsbA family dithiol-disulfide isomerase
VRGTPTGYLPLMIEVTPRTILVYSDIACPWAHLAVHRLWEARARAGLDDELHLDHRAFPLEMFNERATPKRALDAEIPVVGGLEPEAGWHTWDRPTHEYPGSTLLALEAVQATKAQGPRAAEELDRELRRAFFRDRRNITMRHEILAVADTCSRVDPAALREAIDTGVARATVIQQKEIAEGSQVQGSPHLFLPDGRDTHNPGIEMHLADGGFPVVDKDDPSIYDDLVGRAAGSI